MASNIDKSNSDSLKESVLMNLRSVTQSRKGGVPLNCLDRDYKDLLGTPIPYHALGYASLQAFLKDIPNVIKLRYKDGQLIAEGVADSSTAHIVSLVNRQKTAKTVPSRSNRRPPYAYRRGTTRYDSSRGPKFNHKATFKHISPEVKHSKPAPKVVKETKPKVPSPEPPRSKPTKSTYELPPRFRNKEKQLVENNQNSYPEPVVHNNVRPESPCQRIPLENVSVSINNPSIRSPRPLTRTVTIKDDRLKHDRLKQAATAKEYIAQYATMNKIEFQYKTKIFGQKKKNQAYISKLSLGSKVYQSYPDVAPTEEAAEELAASAAMKDIQVNLEHLEYPETPIQTDEEVAILIDRIEEIVCEKPSGMFANGIIYEYENKYNEVLPKDWIPILQQSINVEIEALDVPFGRVPDGVNYIVHRARVSSGSTTPSSVSELEKLECTYDDSGIPRSIVRKDRLPEIPKLRLPPGDEWVIHIVDVSKTIAARFYNYDEDFLNTSERMRKFYASEYLPAIEVSEGLLYATCDAGSDVFHRVLVRNIKGEMVECYFVDEGNFADVPKSDLQELNSEFWNLPYQAIHMQLDGFDLYPFKPDDLKSLLGKTLIAIVQRGNETVSGYFPNDPAVDCQIYSVVLYDTDSKEDEDVNMNEVFKNTISESLVVQLPQTVVSSGGYYLTHVENTGEIYLRKLPPDNWIETSMENLSHYFEEACLKSPTITHNKICAAKFEDGKWYRAELVPNPTTNDPDKIEVCYVDYGNTGLVAIKEVCELEPYSDFLSRVPHQVIKCELYKPLPPNAEWAPAAVAKLFELAPVTEELLIRVIIEETDDILPKVNLYKRIYKDEDSFIISINDTLATKPELFAINTPVKNSSLQLNFNDIRPPVPRSALSTFNSINHNDEYIPMPIPPPSPANDLKWLPTPDNIKSPDALEVHNLPPLKRVELPKIGELFDVFVTMAANPHNFFVQPYQTLHKTNALLQQMDQFYSAEENCIELDLSCLKVNNFYAAKHIDNFWYRVQLQSIIDSSQVLVKYVDYGDLTPVYIHNLQTLYSQFRDLPCQAIQATLFGVKPFGNDWEPLQCVEFSDIVKENKYVSIIKNIRRDTDIVLELDLVDVRKQMEDVYIKELLIQKGIAVRA